MGRCIFMDKKLQGNEYVGLTTEGNNEKSKNIDKCENIWYIIIEKCRK